MEKQHLDFLSSAESCRTQNELNSLFHFEISKFGYNNSVVTGVPRPDQVVDDVIFSTTYPQDWANRFTAKNYQRIDPVSRLSGQTNKPFLWSEARRRFKGNTAANLIMEEAREFGLADGLVVPMFDTIHFKAVIAVTSDELIDLSPSQKNTMSLLCITFKMLIDEFNEAQPIELQISPRETEVLNWAAAGKSNWDISKILSVSQRTIEVHLAQSRVKLQAVNTPHAIAIAARHGLIIP